MSTTQALSRLPQGNIIDYKIVLVLSLVHFTGDFYSAFFTPLLPAFQAKLSLTLTQVGLITGTVRFLSFVVQPVILSYLLMPPTLLMFLYLPGAGAYAGSFLSGFFVLAPMPLGVVMAQKLAPGSRAMAASLMMGLACLVPITLFPKITQAQNS